MSNSVAQTKAVRVPTPAGWEQEPSSLVADPRLVFVRCAGHLLAHEWISEARRCIEEAAQRMRQNITCATMGTGKGRWTYEQMAEAVRRVDRWRSATLLAFDIEVPDFLDIYLSAGPTTEKRDA